MGFNEFIGKLFGNKATRDMKEIKPWVDKVKAVYPEISKLSNDELRARTEELKKYIKASAVEETTKSGIILTAASQEKPQVAEVIAVGPGGNVDGKEIVMEVKTNRVVHALNEKARKYMASTTKIMTCIVALENKALQLISEVAKETGTPAYVVGGFVRDCLFIGSYNTNSCTSGTTKASATGISGRSRA